MTKTIKSRQICDISIARSLSPERRERSRARGHGGGRPAQLVDGAATGVCPAFGGASAGAGAGVACGTTSGCGGAAGGSAAGGAGGAGTGGGTLSWIGGGTTGGGAGGGSGRSSGGEKPRLGNEPSEFCVVELDCVERRPGLGVAAAVLVVSPDQSLADVLGGCVRASAAPRRRLSVVLSGSTCPMRSGMATSAKATNETDPSTSARHGAQRHVSTRGSPFSRIQPKA